MSHAAAITNHIAPACASNLSNTLPNGSDTDEPGLYTLRDDLLEELLQEQPLLNWLEWDLPSF
jgi:hypothetical protein